MTGFYFSTLYKVGSTERDEIVIGPCSFSEAHQRTANEAVRRSIKGAAAWYGNTYPYELPLLPWWRCAP
jgi:hypothetical protein